MSARPRRTLQAVAAFAWYLPLLLVAGGLTTAWLAGWRLQVVETGSMTPGLPIDALAVTAPVSPRSVDVGDVIAFEDPHHAGRTILHRVTEVDARDGRLPRFTTQGDANTVADAGPIRSGLVQGRLMWSVPRLGAAVRYLYELPAAVRWGVLVALPAVLGLLDEWRRGRKDHTRRPALAPSAVQRPDPLTTKPVQLPTRRRTTPRFLEG